MKKNEIVRMMVKKIIITIMKRTLFPLHRQTMEFTQRKLPGVLKFQKSDINGETHRELLDPRFVKQSICVMLKRQKACSPHHQLLQRKFITAKTITRMKKRDAKIPCGRRS